MGFFDFFKNDDRAPLRLIYDEIGEERTVKAIASILVLSLGYVDPAAEYATQELRISQSKCLQFLREEFDAAYDARKYGVKLACLDNMLRGIPESGYIGARDEHPQYPIDDAGGPQQILRRIVTPNALGQDLCAKLSCSVVLRVLEYHKAGYFTDPNGEEGLPCALDDDCFDCRRNSLKITKLHIEQQRSLTDANKIMKSCLGIDLGLKR